MKKSQKKLTNYLHCISLCLYIVCMNYSKTHTQTQKNKGDNMSKREFNQTRGFGIEIEFLANRGKNEVAEILNNLNGIDCVSEDYNHNTRSYWKIVGDSSLRRESGYQYTMELVSPILYGLDGLGQLFQILEVLNGTEENGLRTKVNKSCGIHVHHDLTNWRDDNANAFANNMNNLITLVAKYEHGIFKLLPASRQSGYCAPVRNGFQKYNCFSDSCYNDRIKNLKTAKRQGSLQNIQRGRYYGLNFQNLFTRGSVEFRYHQGSTNYNKLSNWIVFTQAFVETAELKKSISYTESMTRISTASALRRLRCDLGLTKANNDIFLRACDTEIKRRYHVYKNVLSSASSIQQAQ